MVKHDATKLALAYFQAKRYVIANGYGPEIDWQSELSISTLSEPTFLREGAWVILAAGISEQVVRSRFDAVSKAFFEWSSAKLILTHWQQCCDSAMRAFGHRRKIEAIGRLAERVSESDITALRELLLEKGPPCLQVFDFIGPITSFHLAKNLGFDCVKEDRHLRRLAESLGFQTAAELCRTISSLSLDPLRVIDVVLWRFATLNTDYLHTFSDWLSENDRELGSVCIYCGRKLHEDPLHVFGRANPFSQTFCSVSRACRDSYCEVDAGRLLG